MIRDEDTSCFSATASYNDVVQAIENGIAFFKSAVYGGFYFWLVVGVNNTGNEYKVEGFDGYSVLTLSATGPDESLSSCGAQ